MASTATATAAWAVEVNECAIFASNTSADWWTENVLLRPVGNRIKWLAMGPGGGLARIPCEDREEAQFVRDYMVGHGIHRSHVKAKRIKAVTK